MSDPARPAPRARRPTPVPPAVSFAAAVAAVAAAVAAAFALSDHDIVFPFAVAACVATFSSVLLRFALGGAGGRGRRVRVRGFTGERAAYVRTSQRLAMLDRDFTAADYEMLLDLDNNSQRLRRFLEGASEDTIARLPTYAHRGPSRGIAESQSSEVTTADVVGGGEDGPGEGELAEGAPGQGGLGEGEPPVKAVHDSTLLKAHHSEPTHPELGGATVNSCTICLEDFEDGMTIRILPCFHRFMADCIDPWLSQQARCPVCKCSITDVMESSPSAYA